MRRYARFRSEDGAGFRAGTREAAVSNYRLRQPQTQQACRIEIRSLPAHCDVEMRAGGPARATAQTYDLTALYLIPFLHFEFGEVEVKGEQALPVIQHDKIPLEIQRPRQQHRTVIHRGDGCATGDAEIQA